MNDKFQTVFQVSYLGNGVLAQSVLFLAIGLAVAILSVTGRLHLKKKGGCAIPFVAPWCVVWISVSSWMVIHTLRNASTYINALQTGQCQVVEGLVTVVHEQPYSGHDAGDRIRVNDVEFQFSAYDATLAYDRTISHGGHLTNGTLARLHHLNGHILKVEVARR